MHRVGNYRTLIEIMDKTGRKSEFKTEKPRMPLFEAYAAFQSPEGGYQLLLRSRRSGGLAVVHLLLLALFLRSLAIVHLLVVHLVLRERNGTESDTEAEGQNHQLFHNVISLGILTAYEGYSSQVDNSEGFMNSFLYWQLNWLNLGQTGVARAQKQAPTC